MENQPIPARGKKITIVVNGKFHSFDFAAELNRRGQLRKLISSMPYSVAKKYGIGRSMYVGLPVFEVLKRSWRKLFRRELPTMWYAKIFAKTASFFIPRDTDVLIGSAGYSKEFFENKKFAHSMKVLDRSSTHTLSNIELKKAAAAYHGTDFTPHADAFIEREIEEYNIAEKILVPAEFVKDTFLANAIAEKKMIKIPYAVGTKKFDFDTSQRPAKEKVVLFVGQISPRKGTGVLINAMKLVIKKHPDAKLWLVGVDTRIIPEEMFDQPWIKRWGILRGKDLWNKYMSASVFCLPSYEEGLAYVLTEAVHNQLPVVATHNTGGGEFITDNVNGFLLPAGDHVMLAEKLDLLLSDDDLRERMSTAGSDKTKDLTWPSFCDKFLANI
ncbi:MAG: glycosyltransferase [Chitinophagaceae bacterium]|nr:MAG: glycosyltransferase [Chitinophagaceae bacterium]